MWKLVRSPPANARNAWAAFWPGGTGVGEGDGGNETDVRSSVATGFGVGWGEPPQAPTTAADSAAASNHFGDDMAPRRPPPRDIARKCTRPIHPDKGHLATP